MCDKVKIDFDLGLTINGCITGFCYRIPGGLMACIFYGYVSQDFHALNFMHAS